jgi:hypothetical protein
MDEIDELKRFVHRILTRVERLEARVFDKRKPSLIGECKYPNTWGYYEDLACTCGVMCKDTCKGECGCSACSTAYSDQLD